MSVFINHEEIPMTMPTDMLRQDHVLILRALDIAEAAAGRLEHGEDPGDDWWQALVAWLRGFADTNHHAKEERALFPAMARAGVPEHGGPIGVMLAEHVEGRSFIQAIAAGGRARAGAARAYARLLRAHIDKEDNVLFRIAESVLDDSAMRALGERFEALAVEVGRDASRAAAEAALNALASRIEGAPASTGR